MMAKSALERTFARFLDESGTPGGVLAWSSGGGPVQTVSAGVDIREPDVPITRGSGFLIASISKVFTGVLVLCLVDKGRYVLDQPIGEIAPTWPEARDVTIRQLLSHTSGLAPQGDDDGSDTGPYREAQRELLRANPGRRFTLQEALAWLAGRPLLSPPGTATRYSNTNFLLLAYIAEQGTSRTYVDLLHEYVLDPLGLSRTRYLPDEPDGGLIVSGCFERDGALRRADDPMIMSITSHVGPAGGLVSSAADLSSFGLRVLRNRELLSGQLASQAFTISSEGTGLGVLGVIRASSGRHPFQIFGPPSPDRLVGFGGSGQLPGASSKVV